MARVTKPALNPALAASGGKAKPTAASKRAAAQAPTTPTPSGFPAILPQRGSSSEAQVRRMSLLNKVSGLKEGVGSVLTNDFVERSFPTGSIVIDEVLGIREIPAHGRMVQVHGEEHSGKSTLLYHFAGAYQKVWNRPVWIWDIEGQLKPDYLWQCGLDPDPSMTYLRQTTDVNEILRNTWQLMGNGKDPADCDYFIFDSVACMTPPISEKDILAGKALDPKVGDQARMFKRFLQLLQPRARVSDSCIHFVNQQSSIIPQTSKEQMAMKYATITNWNYTITGGKAARYFPSLMLMTAKGKAFEGAGDDEKWIFPVQGEGKDKIGVGRNWDINRTQLRVLKNKINDGGYREYHIYIRPGGGIDDWASVRELAKHYNLISTAAGKGTIIGRPEAPIETFRTQAEAIKALVIEERLDLLEKLRALTVDAIRADDPRKFRYERTQADKFTAGDSDIAPMGLNLDLEDDDVLSGDGEGDDIGADLTLEVEG